MDFGKLLSVAQKNEQRAATKPCYQTKFAPPKKESKQSKVLSNNIKKFLARKEEEERRKALEEQRKKEQLLSLRDHKAQSRINKHLKVCKAANKSAIADAIDHENTAVTLAGPAQCDEDDYGYVSQEASAYYNKLMSKYNSLPPEKPLFSKDGKKTVKDIASTKDRVKQALKQQELEESLPHRRKRKHKDSEHDRNGRDRDSEDASDYKDKSRDGDREKDYDRDRDRDAEREEKPKIKKKPMPPPMDFTALLKLAEKKQYEPIKIEPKPKPKEEPERLMTKRQMKEYAKEKEWREKKDQRSREQQNPKPSENSSADSSKSQKTTITKAATSNGHKIASDIEKTATKTLPSISKKPVDKVAERSNSMNRPAAYGNNPSRPVNKSNGEHRLTERSQHSSKTVDRINNANRPLEKSNGMNKNSSLKVSAAEKDAIAEERRKLEEEKRKLEEMRRSIEEEKKKLMMSKNKKIDDSRPSNLSTQKPSGSKARDSINQNSNSKNVSSKPIPPNNVKSRPFPPPDVKSRPFPPSDVKPRQFPPPDVKPRQFPPPDVRSSKPKPGSSKLKVNKRRIYDEDDEDYDSELDDFIDDGPEEEGADYSKYISEIFGYDKSKYRNLDDGDDAAMESNFAQQLKEEFVSTKIGYMEDLEDIRQEALEKKRKKEFMKKKMKR